MTVRVAIVGAHGAGKTTLALALRHDLVTDGVSAAVTPEVPRLIVRSVGDPEWFRRGRNTIAKQLLIILGQCAVERSPERRTAVLICDRSIVDHWAYTLELFSNEIRFKHRQVLEQFIALYAESYDVVLRVPPEFDPVDDGVREGDVEFRDAIDERIRGLLSQFSIPYSDVSGSLQDRRTYATEVIREYL